MSFHRARRQFLHRSMAGTGGMALLHLLNRDLDGAAALRSSAAQQISGFAPNTQRCRVAHPLEGRSGF